MTGVPVNNQNIIIKEVPEMLKRILVPLDTSELAEIALPYAEEMAVKLRSEVTLLHVRTSADGPDKPEHQAYISRMTAQTEQNIKKAPDLPPGEKVKVDSAVIGPPHIITHPAEQIVDYADEKNYSLIVMATHGRTGIRRWALGDTADKVARAARCPVLLIRAAAGKHEVVHIEKILVPLDGSRPAEAVIPYIESLASKLKIEIVLYSVVELLFHLYPYSEQAGYYGTSGVIKVPYNEKEMQPAKEVAEKYIKAVNDKLKEAGVSTSYTLSIGSPADEIIRLEKEMHPDLVLMSTHGHSGFGRFDHGSIADKVLHAGSTPLLLVRPRQP
jgi:nucleotide-binding universal stress UspA family protein